MKRRWIRTFSGALAVLALCARFGCACAAPPAVSSFSFERSGSSVGQARSYSIRETARGRFAWIELYYAYHIVLPVSDEEMEALSALIAALELSGWNGFDETDTGALDGERFSLRAAFADGSALTASGSNRFPADYAEKTAHIEAFFHALMDHYEIDL